MRKIVIALLCLFFVAAVAFADEREEILQNAKSYLRKNQMDQAIAYLKAAADEYPTDKEINMLLANTYLKQGNRYFALRRLTEFSLLTEDCESRSVIAELYIEQADLARAKRVLLPANDEPPQACLDEPTMFTRWNLLLARIAVLEDDPGKALEYLKKARTGKRIFVEDRELMENIRRSVDEGWIDPVSVRLRFSLGYNTNALLASDSENAATAERVESFVVANDHELRVVLPVSRVVRPDLSYRGKIKHFLEPEASDVGYYQPSVRAGALFRYNLPRIGLYYAGEATRFFGGDFYTDDAWWFSEAHRAEFDLEATPWLLAFGGGGLRRFREMSRTRTEFDGGLAVSYSPISWFAMSLISQGSFHSAEHEAYNAWGASGLPVFYFYYYRDGNIRLAGAYNHDDYPDSTGYFDPDTARVDETLRFIPAIWSPTWEGMRIGVTYEYQKRQSSVKLYEYDLQEAFLVFGRDWDWNPFGPRRVYDWKRTPFDYKLGASGHDQEQLRELLRQEESAQRSSTCVK